MRSASFLSFCRLLGYGIFFAATPSYAQTIDSIKLPPVAERTAIGTWKYEDNICAGSILLIDDHPVWTTYCVVGTGIGNGTHGIKLAKIREGQYKDSTGEGTYVIQSNGDLVVRRPNAKDKTLHPGTPDW